MNSPRMRILAIVSALVFVAILLVPLALRIEHPSLYADDVARVGELQEERAMGAFLFAPFNEHMVPLFQGISLATWALAGKTLTHAPLAFTFVAFLPHVLALILLGILVRRETQSATTALVAVAMFGLSGLITETFSWYSASTFSWALVGTLLAIECAGRSLSEIGGKQTAWLIGSSLAVLAAPAFSAIGLLAGPLAVLRLGTSAKWKGIVPLIGSFVYLLLCLPFRYGVVVSQSLERNVDLAAVFRNVACAPVDVLLPGLFGQANLAGWLPDPFAMSLTAVLGIVLLCWAVRDRSVRPLILVGIVLIVGGYLLAFGARSAEAPSSLRHVQRYQLFPQVGLVLLLAIAGRKIFKRFDESHFSAWSFSAAAAGLILLVQSGPIGEHARLTRFPAQAQTLAAIERLSEACKRQGITRSQCLAALDPIRYRWFDFELNALILMPNTASTPSLPDREVRQALLGSLNHRDRESLFGGMDISKYLVATEPRGKELGQETAKFVRSFEMTKNSSADHWTAGGWASFLEYEFVSTDRARLLALSVNGPVELWWSSDGRIWKEARSIRWRTAQSAEAVDRVVSLKDIPHWDAATVHRVRIAPRKAGPFAASAPRLLR